MDVRWERLCAWCGPLGMTFFFVGLALLARFLPPVAPSLDAEAVAAIYRGNSWGIRVGAIFMLWAIAFMVPLVAAVTTQLKRIGPQTTSLAYAQLISGFFGILPALTAVVFWSAAAFRPERSAEEILLMSDIAWIMFVMVAPPGLVQAFSVGLAIFSDKRAEPIFPRWLGYLNLWIGMLFIPGCLIVLFKTGPFAWDGLLAWWVPVSCFGGWYIVMFIYLLKAIDRQGREG